MAIAERIIPRRLLAQAEPTESDRKLVIVTFGGGVRNVFNTEPPLVDGSEVLAVNNVPIGVGYDLNGRVYFFNIQANFGGEL